MLRDRTLAALNQLHAYLLASAADYRHVTSTLPERSAELISKARCRELLAERLAQHIRKRGDLPDAFDPERELITHAATTVRAWVTDRARASMHELDAADRLIDSALAEALASAPPRSTRQLLREIHTALRPAVTNVRQHGSGAATSDRTNPRD